MTRKNIDSLRVLVMIVVGVWLGLGIAPYMRFPDWPTRGQFGDMFGAANSLFSALAFAGVVYAILLQRQELAHTISQTEENRREIERAARLQALSTLVKVYTDQLEWLVVHKEKEIPGSTRGDAHVRIVATVNEKVTRAVQLLEEDLRDEYLLQRRFGSEGSKRL